MATITLPTPGASNAVWGTELNTAITAVNTDVESRALDSAVVHNTGNESIAGVKTFASAPLVPNSAFTIAKVTGLQAALDAAGSVKTVNTVTPDGAGNVAITMDNVPDGTTRLGYSTTERALVEDRANHTGTQSSSTIIDFASAARIAAKTGIVAGSGISVVPGAGETVTVSATAPPPGSGYARTTYAYTTASLASAAQESGTIPVGNEYTLSKVQFSGAARLRVYATVAQRTADASRGAVAPTGDHGVMFEYTSTGAETFTIAPAITCANFESSVNAPILIDNTGGSTATITVTFTYKRTE